MRYIKHLILHCSATPEGRYFDKYDILRWHTAKPPVGHGWKTGGYHKLILLDGTIEHIYPYERVTNGAVGFNFDSIHFCYIGGVGKDQQPKDTRTKEQKETMTKLVKETIKFFPKLLIAGHRDLNGLRGRPVRKACPSFDTDQWLKEIGISEDHFLVKL